MNNGADTSEQVRQWRGEFGNEYVGRCPASDSGIRARMTMWAKILAPERLRFIESFLEVGANIGNNLQALHALTNADLYALEPNESARKALIQSGVVHPDNVIDGAASRIALPDNTVDLAFTCGVLIHIHPDNLLESCREIHRVARRYIACVEYFSDQPEEITYRGHSGLLFKRDFGEFWIQNFSDLKTVDYGFFWKRITGLDNLTWWLFEKR